MPSILSENIERIGNSINLGCRSYTAESMCMCHRVFVYVRLQSARNCNKSCSSSPCTVSFYLNFKEKR